METDRQNMKDPDQITSQQQKRKYGEGPAPKAIRVPWETFKGPVFLNKDLCTLLIIGILQGLGIDPKNHGPLGYLRKKRRRGGRAGPSPCSGG